MLRKTAYIQKKAGLSEFWNKGWRNIGNAVKKGADKIADLYDPNGPETRTDVTREDVAKYLQRNLDRGGKWATPEGRNSAALMYSHSSDGGRSLNFYRKLRSRLYDKIKYPMDPEGITRPVDSAGKLNGYGAKELLRSLDDKAIIRGLNAFIDNRNRWAPPSKAEQVLDSYADKVNRGSDLLY